MSLYKAATDFVKWLDQQVLFCARGDNLVTLSVEPRGRFWLGRLASEESVAESALGERGERLEPCAVGIRIRPAGDCPWTFKVAVRACIWIRNQTEWEKKSKIEELIEVSITEAVSADYAFGRPMLEEALSRLSGLVGLSCELRVEIRRDLQGQPEMTILLVNTSPKEHPEFRDTNLYESSIEVTGLKTESFTLESLPDSFRYDRRVAAYGVNSGIDVTQRGSIVTVDTVSVDKKRINYWNLPTSPPDFSFSTLSKDPIPSLKQLVSDHARWGMKAWAAETLEERAVRDQWSSTMLSEAKEAAEEFWKENKRLKRGLILLESMPNLLKAFKLMNRAIAYAANGRYVNWRPFQVGFLLANLSSIANREVEADIVDVVWFTTGGGKTETYLGLLVTAALNDRLEGKVSGITAWSRFPLRMLSLQQTQRFADAMAGAERVRREADIPGDPFSVGFFVGQGATPNSLREDAEQGEQYDVDDDEMPRRCRVLLKCPFCHSNTISMEFDRRYWRLQHLCTNQACSWSEQILPFYICFWTSSGEELARRYVAIAPRGVTIEYAVDRTVTEVQKIIRDLCDNPESICAAAGVEASYAGDLISLYGVDVIYGNTLRDLDAVARSLETQIGVDGQVNTASLTGRTEFDQVRATLDRLENPESDYLSRIHIVTASSMMSHGVDIDRLNVMVMLGTPLTAAEFIQATARIGRRWPGVVYVMQKMARERDASVFRCFDKFVVHGDRFVEPIPITRRSRRVLAKTLPGLYLARILAIHEAKSGQALTTVSRLRDYFSRAGIAEAEELASLVEMLRFDSPMEEALRQDLQKWVERFFSNLEDPGGTFKFPADLSPTGRPMRSLRDVEEEVPIFGL